MEIKVLERAKEIEERIKQLDKEIDLLLMIMPPKRKEIRQKGRVVRFIKLHKKRRIKAISRLTDWGGNPYEFEMTNEDFRAIIDLREQEKNELQKELEEL